VHAAGEAFRLQEILAAGLSRRSTEKSELGRKSRAESRFFIWLRGQEIDLLRARVLRRHGNRLGLELDR
jgi:hypothetical protein